MTLRKTLFFICLVISMGCLAVGYGIAGQWIGAASTTITGLVWLLARKYPASWLPHICLLMSICLAVAGLLTGTPSMLMICGAGFALAVWDILFLDDALKNRSYDGQTRRYENKHVQSLTLALGFGLIVAFVGRTLNFALPFIVMLLLVALVIFGFEHIWSTIKR